MNIADYFAATGMVVVVPKILCPPLHGGVDGDGVGPSAPREEYPPWMRSFAWQDLRNKIASYIAFLRSMGVTKICMVGFCWGSWVVFKATADFPDISAVAAVHPSLQVEEAFGGSVEALAKRVHVPTLVLPAGNDPDIYRAGGVVVDALRSNNAKSAWSDDFKDMVHGWVPRGDIADPNVSAKVRQAMERVADFLHASAAETA